MEWTITDLKLINAWSVLCFAKDDGMKTIEEIVIEVNVPDKYVEEVSVKIANRRIEILSSSQ